MAAQASYQIPAVENFDFSQPERWPSWIRRFERFRHASGIVGQSEESQVNTLIYSMGDKAEDILRSLDIPEADLKRYDKVKDKFEQYFVKRRNVVFERAKFNTRVQKEAESVDDFITDVYRLAEHCEFSELHNEMVRDRIVVGIKNSQLSEKMQLDRKLTLEKAVSMARQSETVKQQQAVVREGHTAHEGDSQSVDMIQKRDHQRGWRPRAAGGRRKVNVSTKPQVCTRCGKSPQHGKGQCPAREAICHKCGKKGHYKKMCWSKQGDNKVGVVRDEEEEDRTFLGVVQSSANRGAPWITTVSVNDCAVEFKIDTGADVTVIPRTEYQKKRDGPLRASDRMLTGAGQQQLHVQGKFTAHLKRNNVELEQEIFVVKGLDKPLLGRPAIEGLKIVSLVGPVQAEESVVQKFPKLFQGLGRLKDNYTIKLRENAEPYALNTPRRVAIPLLPKVKAELERMENMGVITRVTEPTDWCAGMVVVPKSNGTVRICVDLTKLNESVRRERHIMPSVEQTLAQIGGATVFSKLDANSGFWQVELARESALLTTFITPFGRFCFNRMPFGITSAPEYFQRRMNEIVEGLSGVVCLVDDILVHGTSQKAHDDHLVAVLERIQKEGLTLSKEKCKFNQTSVKFLGQVLDSTGIKPDPDKLKAIQEMPAPRNITELRRFLGMINQLSKFSPHLADQVKPLRDLLSLKNEWLWETAQESAFAEVKKMLQSPEVLARYNPSYETMVSADASSYGLGAVLRQKQPNGDWRPITYISRALTNAEQKYAQIEKEALAVTWACERFHDYLLGLHFQMQTDHKPLVPLLSCKALEELPLRVQRFRLRLMRYDFTIVHVPGADLNTADTLSRAPVSEPTRGDEEFQREVQAFVESVMENIPATAKRLQEIKSLQQKDPLYRQLLHYTQRGWPDKFSLRGLVKKYYSIREELSVYDGILLRGSRLVIPEELRAEMLERLHSGHQGITKCCERARLSCWWPGLRKELTEVVSKCATCCQHRQQRAEQLISSAFPEYPWQKVGTDLFVWNKANYLLVVDYYSRYIEVAKLQSSTSGGVINHMKSIFARHGVPETVVSDNGPQYVSEEFIHFSKDYGFTHITSSPKYPQSNGEAERAVQTVKGLLKKNKDPYLALLVYRSTPLENGYSPAELLMGRQLRSNIPGVPMQFIPCLPNHTLVRRKEEQIRERHQRNFNQHHGARDLEPLKTGNFVWVTDKKSEGTIVRETDPRSYLVQTSHGTYRRNRRHLVLIPQSQNTSCEDNAANENSNTSTENAGNKISSDTQTSTEPQVDGGIRTRSGRISRPPQRL